MELLLWQKKTACSDGLLVLRCEKVQLVLHCFSKLNVRNMDIQPSDSLTDAHRVDNLGVLSVLKPSLPQKRAIGHRYGAEFGMELTMPHDWHRTDKGVADSFSVATAPISPLVADMVTIRSGKRRDSSASSLFLFAHNNTPLSEQRL